MAEARSNGWKQVSLILGGMAALAGIHAGVVVPAILHEAAQETTACCPNS
jgi:hypothetical protein